MDLTSRVEPTEAIRKPNDAMAMPPMPLNIKSIQILHAFASCMSYVMISIEFPGELANVCGICTKYRKLHCVLRVLDVKAGRTNEWREAGIGWYLAVPRSTNKEPAFL
jgi:hypothetical protein